MLFKRKGRSKFVCDPFTIIRPSGRTLGREALDLHARMHPTIVTMDLTMPEMDGNECVAELVKRDPDIRILVISALADKATAIDALEKGASGFLCKPFTDRQLNEALRKLIEY